MMTDASLRYSRTAMWLHWAIALLLVYNFALGERTEDLERGPELFAIFQLHKSIGITVLLLSVWRLWVRLRHPRPAPVVDGVWAKRLSSLVHTGFYVVMIGAPLTGWIIVSTSKTKIPTLLFGMIPWPHLPLGSLGRALHEVAEEAHEAMATVLIGLIALHVIGAIRHQFFMKDGLIERMMPVSPAGIGAVALAFVSLGASFAMGKVGPVPGLSGTGQADVSEAAPPATPALAATERAAEKPLAAEPASQEAAAKDEEGDEAEKDKAGPTAVPVAAAGPVPNWQVAPGGRLGFVVTVSGEKVTGQFGRWTANIAFDPDRLAQSSITANIDLSSVGSGDGQRDEMLAGTDFFATAAHPSARFVSNEIRSDGPGRYEARGTLSLKGQTRPIRLNFELNFKGDTVAASGSTSMDRRKFEVGTGQFADDDTISKLVAINFNFNARKVTGR
jgi:cytochrome b561/polyisoprenoid-binding protein YceI